MLDNHLFVWGGGGVNSARGFKFEKSIKMIFISVFSTIRIIEKC